jgi:heme A synthase
MIFALSLKLLRMPQMIPRIRRYVPALLSLLAIQLALGAYTVLSRKAVDITTAHVATGALILVTCVLVFFQLARVYQVRLRRFSFVYLTERALA